MSSTLSDDQMTISETKTDDTSVCVICLEDLNHHVINYNCKHILHITCLLDYVKSQIEKKQDITCPICRNVECSVGSQHYETVRQMFGYTVSDNLSNTMDVDQATHGDYIISITESNTQNISAYNNRAYFKLLCGLLFVVSFFVTFIVVVKKVR